MIWENPNRQNTEKAPDQTVSETDAKAPIFLQDLQSLNFVLARIIFANGRLYLCLTKYPILFGSTRSTFGPRELWPFRVVPIVDAFGFRIRCFQLL
jgi:hypothetical protein